jgi:hypothetical protein
MTGIENLDRVIIITEYKQGLKVVPVGTIATCREYLNKETILVQYGFIDGEPQYIGLPLARIRKVTQEDLDTVKDYKQLIPKVYHNGNKYLFTGQFGPDRIGIITGVRLAANEMEDIFTIKFPVKTNGSFEAEVVEDFTREKLDHFASYIPYETETLIDSSIEQKEPDKTIENSEDCPIRINVDGIEFSVIENNIILPSVNLKDIDKLIESLNKLSGILRKDD